MALDLACPRPAPRPALSWRDYLTVAHQRRRPRWMLLMLLTAVNHLVMPSVHRVAFGDTRIVEATVQAVRDAAGVHLSSGAEEAVREQLTRRSPWVAGAAGMVAVALAVLLAGMVLNVGALIAGADLSAAHALTASSAATLVVAVLRVCNWAALLALLGPDRAVAPDWVHVAQANAAVFADPEVGRVWLTFLGSLDAFTFIGVAVSVVWLRQFAPDLGVAAGVAASLGWTVIVVTCRVGLSALLGVPLL